MANEMCATLCHYGIIGQKWGVRRFQPYPKGYSGSGKELGKAKKKRHNAISEATLAAITRKKAAKIYGKAVSRNIADPTEYHSTEVKKAREEFNYWNNKYKSLEKRAKRTVSELQDKYGKEAIADIPYKDGTIQGKVFTKKQFAARGALAAGLIATGPFVPGPGSLMALMAMPSKSIEALNYAVKVKKSEGRETSDWFERQMYTADEFKEKVRKNFA